MKSEHNDGRHAVAVATLKEVQQLLTQLQKDTLPRQKAITIISGLLARPTGFDEGVVMRLDGFTYPTSGDKGVMVAELYSVMSKVENLLVGRVLAAIDHDD